MDLSAVIVKKTVSKISSSQTSRASSINRSKTNKKANWRGNLQPQSKIDFSNYSIGHDCLCSKWHPNFLRR
jgi:hypothetical protein